MNQFNIIAKRFLLNKGFDDIIAFDLEEFNYLEKDSIEVVIGDIRNKQIVNQNMKSVDIVIHAAAALPLSALTVSGSVKA